MRGSDLVLILVALLFPPAAVYFIAGCGGELLLDVVLTILGYIPGHIRAFYLIYKRMKAEEEYGTGPDGVQYVGHGHYQPVDAQNLAAPAPVSMSDKKIN